MDSEINNFSINIATINGSGSQTANQILLKSIFRMGIPVGVKNMFPSNIAGMPTWFRIRVNKFGFIGPQKKFNILVNLNRKTLVSDLTSLQKQSLVLCEKESLSLLDNSSQDFTFIGIPFKELVDQVTSLLKVKKFLTNMIYVGALAEILKVPASVISAVIADHFPERKDLQELNQKAVEAGMKWVQENHSTLEFKYALSAQPLETGCLDNKILMDGNTAAALGLLFGGCTVATWYPITPATSLMETLISYASRYRKNAQGQDQFAALQVEDELAAITGVLGAGWTGARAVTTTSGPGLSLMAEAAGFAYYAEIPAVIWNVQRAGPSTGLPTRTQQSDLIFARYLSHGDTLHPCLIPGNLLECFEFGQLGFDLAERLQQLVIVLSDLDLGMNLWMSEAIPYPEKPFDRGKVLTKDDLEQKKTFFRYQDSERDGFCARTLPGTRHPQAAYFTRGSGHNEKGQYTENPEEYQVVLDRLKNKNEIAKTLVPKPIVSGDLSPYGLITYGATEAVLLEAQALLKEHGIQIDLCRIRALPFSQEVADFISNHEKIIVIDQNSQGQMKRLLEMECSSLESPLFSLRYYNGEPLFAETVAQDLFQILGAKP